MTRSSRRAVPALGLALALAVGLSPAAGEGHADDQCFFQMVGAPPVPVASGAIADDDARTAWQFVLMRCGGEPVLRVLHWEVYWTEIVNGVAGTSIGGPGSIDEGVPEENPMANFHGVFPFPGASTDGSELEDGHAALWDVMIPNLSTYRLLLCVWYQLDRDPEPSDPFDPGGWERMRCMPWGQWH